MRTWQYSPLIGPSETRQPGRSPSSGEKMTAWRRVWSSLRGRRTGGTRWWPRLSPTKTYRWVSRLSRGVTFWRHFHKMCLKALKLRQLKVRFPQVSVLISAQKRFWMFIPSHALHVTLLHCCWETVVTDLPALDLLLYGCLPWNVPLLQFIAMLEYRWRLRGGLRLRRVAGIYRHLWLAVMTAGTGLKVQMCVFVGKQLQLYECKVNIFRVSIFRPGLIIPQDSSLTNLAPDSYQKIRIVAIFQRSASPLPARTLAITPQSVKLSPAAALSNKAANDSSVFTITEKAPIRAFSWLKAPTSAVTFKTLC